MTYLSDETGSFEPHLRRSSGEGGRWPIPFRQATQLRWSADGREILYRQDGLLYAVSVELGEEPSFGEPRALLAVPPGPWARSPDGTRYLAPAPRDEEQLGLPLVLLLNWLDHLWWEAL